MRRLLAVALATLAFSAVSSAPAFAQSADPNSGTLVYSGTQSSEGSTTDVDWTLDCADGLCRVDGPFPEVVFDDGTAAPTSSGTMEDAGCAYDATSSRSLRLTPDSITGTSTVHFNSLVCDGQAQEVPDYTTTFDLAHVSGDGCLIDASCAGSAAAPAEPAGDEVSTEEALAGAGGPFTPGGRNDVPLPSGGSREFAAPTELSQVATLADVITPANVGWAAGGTVVLGLLVVLPTAFANSAADTLIGRMRARWRARRGLPDDAPTGLRGWAWAAAGVAAATVITAFADPNLGFDPAALRVLLSIAAAFVLEVGVGWLAVILLMRVLAPTARPGFAFTPLSLLVVAGAVLLARVSGFEPAIVFGLVAGVVFAGLVTAADHARVALITLGWAYGIGIVAWLVYSALDPTDPGLVVVRELLAAATLAGISALPIALLPLSGLPGATIWAWRKPVWIAVYALALFTFLLILLPLPGAWSDVGAGLVTWIVLFVVYCLAAVGVWLAVNRPWAKEPAQA